MKGETASLDDSCKPALMQDDDQNHQVDRSRGCGQLILGVLGSGQSRVFKQKGPRCLGFRI